MNKHYSYSCKGKILMKSFKRFIFEIENERFKKLKDHPQYGERKSSVFPIQTIDNMDSILKVVHTHIKKHGMPDPKKISINKLHSTQDWVRKDYDNIDNEESWHPDSDRPLVVTDSEKKSYILDGHHRLTDDKMNNKTHSYVHHFDINGKITPSGKIIKSKKGVKN